MPIYSISAPDGNTYKIEGPDGATQDEVIQQVLAQHPEAGNAPTKESGVLAQGKKGLEQLVSGFQTTGGVAFGDKNEAARAALARQKEFDKKYEQSPSLERTKETFQEKGFLSGLGQLASDAPDILAAQIPQFGLSYAGGRAGAAAGAKAGSVLGPRGRVAGALLGGVAGTVGASYPGQFSGNIETQAEEQVSKGKPIDINVPAAAGTAVPQAALDAVSNLPFFGRGLFGKMLGIPKEVLERGSAEAVEKLAKESLAATVTKGTAVGFAAEFPTEVLQQVLQRYQAGQSLTSPEAYKEYGEIAYQTALLSPLGTAGRALDKSGAKAQVQQKAMEQQRADAAAAAAAAPKPPDITDPAYLQQIQAQYQEAEQRKADLKSQLRKVEDGSVTETADLLHNKEIEDQIKAMTPELEQLAAEYNKASKVAPAFTPEAVPGIVETPKAVKTPEAPKQTLTVGDALDNPLGRFSKEELSSRSPKVVSFIDEQRKKLGKPALNDYSIEDIRDAMPGELPDAEKSDLNSLIAAKSGHTGEVVYKPEDIINVAKQKNIATDTDGFKFFLQRATGDNDVTKMEQPQLHSAFTALSALPEFDETQYLPEKTNATHYSPQQYRSAVEQVSGLASEKDIPSAQALQVAKKVTGLTRDSDVQLLLQNAYTNGDLNLSSKGNFITAQPAEQAEFKVEEGFAKAQPTGFNVMRGDQLLYSTKNEDEAKAKVESLSKTADPAMKQIDKSIANERNTVAASQRSLDIMEAAGLFRTPKYQQASAEHAALVQKSNENIGRLQEKMSYLQQPVTIRTTGKPSNVKVYRSKEQGVSSKEFNTREEALKHILENLPAARLNELAGKTKAPGFSKRLQAEVERRKNPPKQFVATQPKAEAKVEPKVEATAEKEALKSNLLPMLKKFGLGDVALQIEDGMEAEGSYAASVIKVALDASNPVRVLRHESVHGLKDLGFFTPGQWKVLENQANKVWIDKYLKQRNINGQPIQGGQQSRYEAYQNLYDGDMNAIREEAIADAFGDFDVNGAPKGLFSTLLKQMQQFFEALRNAFTGAGFQTSDDVFGQVERGELKATKKVSASEKASLRTSTDEVPLSTRRIMESNKTFAQNELGLSTTKKKGATGDNNVREVANALNKKTLSEFGGIDPKDWSKAASDKLADAIADEVGYQLRATSTTGTGAGWYSNNYPKALKRLATRFPELESNPHARSVFSALVAITSNGERVDKNISNAIELYSKLRDGKPLVAMGVRRATALDNNLVNLQNLLQQYGTDFQKEMTKEITVRDLNAYLRSKGKEADNSYLADTKIPAAAIHFGPKLGAFFANLSGSEGYLTMDLWWTRSINRMRGQLMPQATDSSIAKFREMMDKPDATRDEVVAATIPFRNKYKDYGYQTELEYLAKSKEPQTNVGTEAWFKKAKRAAGAAYPQLEFEHKMEKMANTIYKNEYDMLKEAPFSASDRQFMYDAARKAQNILANNGVNLTLADIQAALWYYEKRLYAKLTGREADDIGYEEAIIAQSKNGNGRARPSVVFSGQPDGGNVTAGEVAVSDQYGGGINGQEKAGKQGIKDENISPRELTARSSDRGRGRRNAADGAKLSLREDIRSYRRRDEVQSRTHTRRGIGDGGSLRVLGAKPIAQYSPTESFKRIVNEYGHQSPVFYEISGKNADVYEQAIQESKDASPYGASVYVYPVEDYAKMRLFMTEDGKSGVALKDDDIVSVFSGPPHKGSVNSSIQLAIEEGGRRLDAFATVLPQLYNANGFQVVGRMKWNEDYKPDNWNKKTFSKFNNGEPDVVYMAYNPDDNRTVFENPGEYFDDPDELAQAQKDAVNTYFNEGTGYGTARQIENARRLQTQAGKLQQQGGVRGGIRLLDDKTRAKYPNLEKPVKGLPATVNVNGVDVTFGPYIAAREAAVLHAEESGIPYRQQASYHKVDPEFSKMLASSYARMLDEPNAPQVKAAYKAWADETVAQYKAMLKTGIKVEFFPDAIDTYGNPRNSILDVLNNNHLYVFPADGGFGKGGITDEQIRNNPALALTDIMISGRRARVVEVFRATHDFFGHVKEGFGFRAEGEENAFQSHVRMYSPLAARAMTAGTRGQNSEVNYGPNANFNKTASGKDTKYADQKIGLMPEWASTMNIEPDIKSESLPAEKGIVLGTKQPNAQSFTGTHYGKIKTDNLDASKYGTGLQGAEARRLSGYKDNRIKKRVYFYIPKYNGQMPLPESGVGNHVYTQTFDNIINPEALSKLYAEARGDANTMESLIVDAGYDGYAAPSMGMMVILNHNVPANYEGTRPEYNAKKPKLSLRSAPDTPEFKRFFGNSKIVDANGNPKVMYHGTARDITTFKPKQANAIFVTDSPQFAETFGSMGEEYMIKELFNDATPEERLAWTMEGAKQALKDKNISKSEFEEIKNTSENSDATFGFIPASIKSEVFRVLTEALPSRANIMPVYVRAENPFDYKNPEHVQNVLDALNEQRDAFGLPAGRTFNGIKTGNWELIEKPIVQRAIKKLGHDSFYVQEGGQRNLAVYEPSQVKSATGNVGTYDINNPDIRYSLRTDVTEDINNLPNGAAINAAIDRITTARQELGYVERMTESLANRSESFAYFRQKFFDRYNRLNDFDKLVAQQMGGVQLLADQSAHAAALQSDLAAGVAASALGVGNRMGGMPVYRNGYTTVSNENGTVKGAVEIFSPLAKYGDPKIYQAYQFWAGAKRGKRLLASGKEELYTPQDMALAKQLEQQYPEFVSVQKDWIKYNDGLVKYAVDTGVISAKNAAEFTRYSDYVPFYRQIEGEHTIGPNIFQSISGVKAPKKLTGSEAPLADFLETVVRNTQSIIQAGMKNVAAQKAVEGGIMVQMVRKMDHLSSGPNVVTILKNGEKVSYECADKLWVDAVSSLNLPELPFLNFLAMPANFLRAAVTKDPGFMLANLMRDSVSAYVTSGAKLTPVASAVKEMGNVLMNNSPEYQKLLSAGVLGGYEFSRNVEASTEAFAADLRKKTGTKTSFENAISPFKFFWDKLEKGTEASDAATRIAIYKATLAETGNEAEAIHRALEVMNFNRKGSSAVVRIAAASIPFLNARIQGLDVFFRAGIRPFMDANATEQEKQVQRAMLIRGMTMLGLSVMYAAAISGNPDYEKQEEETKDNNWIIPMGEGKNPLKIPIPFEVGTLFKTIPERIYRSFFMPNKENRDTTEDLQKSMKRALQSTFAINPVPQIAAPLLEARDNFSVFTQRNIVGQNMQGIAPEFQVGPGTSKWAEILGKQSGMSPMMLDHVFKGYTGTMGVYAADLLDAGIGAVSPSNVEKPSKRIEQMPIIKRFLADPEARGQITSYFDLKHAVDTTVRTVNLLEKNADPNLPSYFEKNAQTYAARDFMNNLNKQMDDLQKQANMIRAAPIPADEKRDMLSEITKAQNLLVNNIRQIRNIIKP
jgi:hypothetical protein